MHSSVCDLGFNFGLWLCTSRQYRMRSTDKFRVPASSLPRVRNVCEVLGTVASMWFMLSSKGRFYDTELCLVVLLFLGCLTASCNSDAWKVVVLLWGAARSLAASLLGVVAQCLFHETEISWTESERGWVACPDSVWGTHAQTSRHVRAEDHGHSTSVIESLLVSHSSFITEFS